MEATKKFIIENYTNISDCVVMRRIAKVINMGLLSNYGKEYCYATRFAGCIIEMIKTKYGYKVLILEEK